jgi:hypothetical protein
MHRSAFTTAAAIDFTEEFSHHSFRGNTFANGLRVGTITAEHVIGITECALHPNSQSFLADVKVTEAGKLLFGVR